MYYTRCVGVTFAHLYYTRCVYCSPLLHQVCFSAAKAACSFLVSNDTDQQLLVYLRDLLPGIIHTITVSVDSQTDDILLKCLIDVAENIPKYLRPQLPSVLELCIKVTTILQ